MGKHGRFERQKPKSNKKKIVIIIAAIVLTLVLAVVIGAVVLYSSVLNNINQVEVPDIVYTKPTYSQTEPVATTSAAEEETEETTVVTEPPHVASSEDYINFLVVGQSARAGEDSRHADTMILCTVNTYEKTLTLTSLLRDTLIVRGAQHNGHGIGPLIKLNTVYHLGSYYTNGDQNQKIAGSMELINIILNSNFGIEVDHNFEVDFDLFIKVVDLMGGVSLYLTEAEANYLNKEDKWVNEDVQPGLNHLYGSAALAYARMRHADGDGDSDIRRTERQRKLIENLIFQLKFLKLSDLNRIIEEVLPMVSTSMSNAEITETLATMLKILPDLKFNTGGTCPVQGTYRGAMKEIYEGHGEESVLLDWSVEQQTKLMREITEGEKP